MLKRLLTKASAYHFFESLVQNESLSTGYNLINVNAGGV